MRGWLHILIENIHCRCGSWKSWGLVLGWCWDETSLGASLGSPCPSGCPSALSEGTHSPTGPCGPRSAGTSPCCYAGDGGTALGPLVGSWKRKRENRGWVWDVHTSKKKIKETAGISNRPNAGLLVRKQHTAQSEVGVSYGNDAYSQKPSCTISLNEFFKAVRLWWIND